MNLRATRFDLRLVATGLLLGLLCGDICAQSKPPVTIEDAIHMVRIQRTYGSSEEVASFSPDGTRFAVVVWHGDLAKDLNMYSLLLFDARNLSAKPATLVTIGFGQDPEQQHATPISNLQFLPDNSGIAFIGTMHGEPRQVYLVDVHTKAVRQLTRHATEIREYGLAADGEVRFFSAVSPLDKAEISSMKHNGFSLLEPRVAGHEIQEIEAGEWIDPTRQYFVVKTKGAKPELVFDSVTSSSSSLRMEDEVNRTAKSSLSPSGRYAVFGPYLPAGSQIDYKAYSAFTDGALASETRELAAYWGLIDTSTGKVRQLTQGPTDPFGERGEWRILWSPDEKSVVVLTLPPAGELSEGAKTASQFRSIDTATLKAAPLKIEEGWGPIRWDKDGMLLAKGSQLARSKFENGELSPAVALGSSDGSGMNPRYPAGTNGKILVGVKDDLLVAPDIAVHDLTTHETRTLTDLNPELRNRSYGSVEKIFWRTPYDEKSFGYLIKPVGYEAGKRYPLAILLKDEGYHPDDNSFIIDGQEQLSGDAIQMLANAGIMVLFPPSPPSANKEVSSPLEFDSVVAQVESAIDFLDKQGLIDPAKVGISGWSRAGGYTHHILTHSHFPFAAATTVGGGFNIFGYAFENQLGSREEYVRDWGGLPWGPNAATWRQNSIDTNFDNVHTPLLLEVHALTLNNNAEIIAALRSLHRPVDLFYFPGAPHAVKTPLHRLRSLQLNVDWFRFWLQGYEDPAPAKAEQYSRWHEFRKMQENEPKVGVQGTN